MTDRDSLLIPGPESRGAEIISKEAFDSFLEEAFADSIEEAKIGALVLIRVYLDGGQPLDAGEVEQASYTIAQLARQADALAIVEPGTLGVVLKRLPRRSDVHITLDRIEDFIRGSDYGWEISTGAGVFPLCGENTESVWEAARRDLEGAMSSDTWEHEIPRETIRAQAG